MLGSWALGEKSLGETSVSTVPADTGAAPTDIPYFIGTPGLLEQRAIGLLSGLVGGFYNPSDLATVFQDSAATIPAAVGDPVGCLKDKSANGNHLVQASAARRPILRRAGPLYYLEFDGTSDGLAAGPFDASARAAMSVSLAMYYTAQTQAGIFLLVAPVTDLPGANVPPFMSASQAALVTDVDYTVFAGVGTAGTGILRDQGYVYNPQKTKHVATYVANFDGTGVQSVPDEIAIYRDGTLAAMTSQNNDSITDANWGATQYLNLGSFTLSGTPFNPAPIHFYGGILRTKQLTTDERLLAEQFLANAIFGDWTRPDADGPPPDFLRWASQERRKLFAQLKSREEAAAKLKEIVEEVLPAVSAVEAAELEALQALGKPVLPPIDMDAILGNIALIERLLILYDRIRQEQEIVLLLLED